MLFLGGWGALLMTVGASVSVAGNNVGAALSGSRSLFALAEQGDVPPIFGHIHPRFRTPDVAIIVTCLRTLALALTGSFAKLAGDQRDRAADRLRRHVRVGAGASPRSRAPFTIPWGPVVPAVALMVCVAILASATVATATAQAASRSRPGRCCT